MKRTLRKDFRQRLGALLTPAQQSAIDAVAKLSVGRYIHSEAQPRQAEATTEGESQAQSSQRCTTCTHSQDKHGIQGCTYRFPLSWHYCPCAGFSS